MIPLKKEEVYQELWNCFQKNSNWILVYDSTKKFYRMAPVVGVCFYREVLN